MKISIIIPLYNNENYIKECITSVLNQDYDELEIIVVNDGSTDKGPKIVEQMGNSKIKLINQENQGPSLARNVGIDYATGEWILFLDSDDTLAPGALKQLLEKSKGFDLVIASWLGIYPTKNIYFGPRKEAIFEENSIKEICEYLLSSCTKHTNADITSKSIEGPVAKLYSTRIIKEKKIKFPLSLNYAEDVCFNFSYLQECKKIHYINKVVYYASRHSDSLSNSNKKFIPLIEIFNEEIKNRNIKGINLDDACIYRYFYWGIYDLEKDAKNKNIDEFNKDIDIVRKLNIQKIDKIYLSNLKRFELKILKIKNPKISYAFFKFCDKLRNIKRRMKCGK